MEFSENSNSSSENDEAIGIREEAAVYPITVALVRRRPPEEENEFVDVEHDSAHSSEDIIIDVELDSNHDSEVVLELNDEDIDVDVESNIAQEPNLIPSLETPELGVENPIVRLENPHYTPESKKECSTGSETLKRSFSDMQGDDDSGQTCPVCLEPWTSAGAHRLCSLRCGHLFGKSCVLRWLSTRTRAACPQCNAKTRKSDIRELYATKVVSVDTTELEELRVSCAKITNEKKSLELRLNSQMTMTEYYRKACGNAASSVPLPGVLTNTVKVLCSNCLTTIKLEEDSARVFAYSTQRDMIAVSQKSSSTLWPGFGIRLLSPKDWEMSGVFQLHKKETRDLVFHPENTEQVLSVGLDNTAKIFDVVSRSLLLSFAADSALWCCIWDPVHPNLFYCGSGKGDVNMYNIHSPGEPYKLEKGDGDNGPVVSLRRSPLHGFILCCRLQSVTAYIKESLLNFKRQVLDVGTGPFVAMSYDDSRSLLILACRPSEEHNSVRHICYKLTMEEGSVRAEEIYVFLNGSSASRFFRPCLLSTPSRCLYFAFNESRSAVWGWCLESKSKVLTFDVNKPVLDLIAIVRGKEMYLVILTTCYIKCYSLT